MTCPRSRRELGRGPDAALAPGGGLPAGAPPAPHSGPRGRRERGPSADTELCLLSPFPFSSMMCQLSVVESKSATFPSEKARHLLDDSVLESRSPRRGLALASSSAVTNGLSLGKRLRPPPPPPARRGGRGPVCARVCPSPVAVQRPVARQPCSGRQSQGASPFPAWVCPHPAGGPEHGRPGDGAARHAPEPRPRGLSSVQAWSPPPQDFCPWGSRRPQQGRTKLGTAA